jgi:hypothetical protein
MDWESLTALVKEANKRCLVATAWHPEAQGEVIACESNNVRVLVGEHAYQLTTGEIIKV